MRRRFFQIALLAIGLALTFTGKVAAADCGNCGYTSDYGLSYQPELIVVHPVVVAEPYYFPEVVACGDGNVINQGQYHTEAALISQPRCAHPVDRR
jgi:hypothetical protein